MQPISTPKPVEMPVDKNKKSLRSYLVISSVVSAIMAALSAAYVVAYAIPISINPALVVSLCGVIGCFFVVSCLFYAAHAHQISQKNTSVDQEHSPLQLDQET